MALVYHSCWYLENDFEMRSRLVSSFAFQELDSPAEDKSTKKLALGNSPRRCFGTGNAQGKPATQKQHSILGKRCQYSQGNLYEGQFQDSGVPTDTYACSKLKTSMGSTSVARVASMPALHSTNCADSGNPPLKKRMKRAESMMFQMMKQDDDVSTLKQVENKSLVLRPEDTLRRILEKHGISLESIKVKGESFLPITAQQHSSYPQAAQAARDEDLNVLRELHAAGHNLQCANKFGESIIHIVCRRGRADILRFLLAEAKVSIRLRDDLGRTPLHDAAWSDKPNFEVVQQVLRMEPDLLFCKDNRGNYPLAFIPRSGHHWVLWSNFLEENKYLFLPPNCQH